MVRFFGSLASCVVLVCSSCGGSPAQNPTAPDPAPTASSTPVSPPAAEPPAASSPPPAPAASAAPPKSEPEVPLAMGAPALVPVEAPGPLKFSAPAGWSAKTEAKTKKGMIAGTTPDCRGGPDVQLWIAVVDHVATSTQWLAEQYKGIKPKPMKGFDCIVKESSTDAMCAGKVKGLGLVSVYFATTSDRVFKNIDAGEFTSSVAASIAFNGKVADIKDWSRPAGPEARAYCPKAK